MAAAATSATSSFPTSPVVMSGETGQSKPTLQEKIEKMWNEIVEQLNQGKSIGGMLGKLNKDVEQMKSEATGQEDNDLIQVCEEGILDLVKQEHQTMMRIIDFQKSR